MAIGRVCAAGLATMSEVLDPEGPWSPELLQLMLPVAIHLEAERTETMFGATLAAVSSLGGREGVSAFRDGVETVKAGAMNASRAARGLPPIAKGQARPPAGETQADAMMKIAAKLGLRVSKARKPAAPGTKLHGGKK